MVFCSVSIVLQACRVMGLRAVQPSLDGMPLQAKLRVGTGEEVRQGAM